MPLFIVTGPTVKQLWLFVIVLSAAIVCGISKNGVVNFNSGAVTVTPALLATATEDDPFAIEVLSIAVVEVFVT